MSGISKGTNVDISEDIRQQQAKLERECTSRILELLIENEKGITEKTLQTAMPNMDISLRARCINLLLAKSKIEIFKSGSQLMYKIKGDEKTKGDNDEEKVVYSIIEEAGSKGIWIRDIRIKSKLHLTTLNKILKIMEGRKLIKSVKSVAASKKKVYMLFDIEPDISVTGGTWYSNNDFEAEFVEVLNQQCFRYLQRKMESCLSLTNPIEKLNKSYARSTEICDYIRKLGISKVELNITDIESILETLVFDGKIEKHITQDNDCVKMYRAIAPLMNTIGLMRMPCGVCPVSDECHDGGIISPSKCIYFKDWFDS